MNNIFTRLRNNSDLIRVPVVVISFLCVAVIAWANHTQYHVMSEDIPSGMICIKDQYADAYLCSTKATAKWYLSWEAK